MAYIRKTRDVYVIQCYYPETGWEDECEELTLKEAKANALLYDVNTGRPTRIKKRRERIEKEAV